MVKLKVKMMQKQITTEVASGEDCHLKEPNNGLLLDDADLKRRRIEREELSPSMIPKQGPSPSLASTSNSKKLVEGEKPRPVLFDYLFPKKKRGSGARQQERELLNLLTHIGKENMRSIRFNVPYDHQEEEEEEEEEEKKDVLKRKRPQEENKVKKAKRAARENKGIPNPPSNLPDRFKRKTIEMGTYSDLEMVITKRLTATDCKKGKGRLSMPLAKTSEFLKEREKVHLEGRNENEEGSSSSSSSILCAASILMNMKYGPHDHHQYSYRNDCGGVTSTNTYSKKKVEEEEEEDFDSSNYMKLNKKGLRPPCEFDFPIPKKRPEEKNKVKTTKRTRLPLEIPSRSPTNLPDRFKRKIIEMGSYYSDLQLVITKRLTATDCKKGEGRLSMPQAKASEFLKEHEKVHLEGRNELHKKNEILVALIQPNLEKVNICLRQWDMNSKMYVLAKPWNDVVENNRLKEGETIQVWSFRVGDELGLAIVRLPNDGEPEDSYGEGPSHPVLLNFCMSSEEPTNVD